MLKSVAATDCIRVPGQSPREGNPAPLPGAAPYVLDFVKLAALNEGDEFIPFGMRQPNSIGILANRNAVVGDLDLRALVAVRA